MYGGGFGYESEPGDDTRGGLTLDYVGDRYYDPTIGRFISPDPLGLAGGLNLYAYAGDDPVNNVDPSGDWPSRQQVVGVARGAARYSIIGLGAFAGGAAGAPEGGIGAIPGAAAGAAYGSVLASRLLGDSPAETVKQAVINGGLTYGGGLVCQYGFDAYRGWQVARTGSEVAPDVLAGIDQLVTSVPRGRGVLADIPEIANGPYVPRQPSVSGPLIDRLIGRMATNGWDPEEFIEVNGDVIVEGHHRYIAARLTGVDPILVQTTKPYYRIFDWGDVLVSEQTR